MAKSKADRRVTILFYLLTFYIVLQFSWWAYLLISLNRDLYRSENGLFFQKKVLMVAGEGSVFLIILLSGIFIMQRTIRSEIAMVKQQHNFLLSITHELKTPLAAIKLCLETLSKRSNLDKDQTISLQNNALDNTERLHNLIDNVLLATRIENQHQAEPTAAINISLQALKTIERLEQSQHLIKLIKRNIESGIRIQMDEHNFDSVLINLLDNALKYAPNTTIEVKLYRRNESAILEVSDEGAGIPTEFRHLIYEKFYRVGNEETRSKKGTGLGLYIVKELVEQAGGRIGYHPILPVGSKFKVELPLT